MIVTGEQGRDSAIHRHVSILPQLPLASRLPCNGEQSSLCCTVGPCWLSILNRAVCASPSQTPRTAPSPAPPTASWLSKCHALLTQLEVERLSDFPRVSVIGTVGLDLNYGQEPKMEGSFSIWGFPGSRRWTHVCTTG